MRKFNVRLILMTPGKGGAVYEDVKLEVPAIDEEHAASKAWDKVNCVPRNDGKQWVIDELEEIKNEKPQ